MANRPHLNLPDLCGAGQVDAEVDDAGGGRDGEGVGLPVGRGLELEGRAVGGEEVFVAIDTPGDGGGALGGGFEGEMQRGGRPRFELAVRDEAAFGCFVGREDEEAVFFDQAAAAGHPAACLGGVGLGFGGEFWRGLAFEVEIEVVIPSRRHGAERETGRRELGAPRGELCAEACGDLGVLRGEVVLLFEIAAEVVKVFAIPTAQEFPVSFANRALSHPAPREELMRRVFFLAGEVREEVHAIEIASIRDGSDFHRRRCNIERTHWMLIHLPAGNGAGPGDEKRHVHAALGEHTFFAIQRRVQAAVPTAGIAFERRVGLVDFERSAVVADEEDERLLGEAVLFQHAGDAAHAIVHGAKHGERGASALRHGAGEALHVTRRCIERRVRCTKGDVEKERIVLVALDDRRGGLRAAIEVIRVGRVIAHRAVFAIHGDVRGEGLLPVLRKDMPEAMPRDLGERPEVPFAELRRDVARVLQPRGEGGLLVESIERGAVVIEIESPLKAPRHEPATRWHTLRCGAVTMLRDHAAARQRIEMRRAHILLNATDAEIGEAVVVGVEDDDVGTRRSRESGEQRAESEE